MIDLKPTVSKRRNGRSRNGRLLCAENRSQAPAYNALEIVSFTSFQDLAEQTLRNSRREPSTALTLASEEATNFRGLVLAKAEVERIRSEVFLLHQRHGSLSLGFASAQNGEGTSTILANLVLDLKKTNLRVLLVDFNIRHANLPSLFSLPKTPGLVDLINGRRSLNEVIRVIKANQIFLMPLGEPGQTQGFDLETSVRAINNAGKNSRFFDLILFDLPPLNEVPQSLYAVRQIDGLIQIVQAERTRAEVLRSLKSKLEHVGARSFGVIMNQRRFYIPQFIYEKL